MAASLPQVRMLAFNNEEIGMGFNSATGLAVGTALEGFHLVDSGLGAEASSSVEIIESHEQLMSMIGLSFEAQGRYSFFSGGIKAAFSETTNYNSTSTFIVARMVVRNPLRRGSDFAVKPAAQQLLTAAQMPQFQTAFGDSFVRGLQTGGEFYAVIRITSMSQSTQKSLSLSAHAEANGLVASGSFKAAFEEANRSESSRSEFNAVMYQHAGEGASVAPVLNLEEVLARLKSFPDIVRARPGAYEIEVASYDTLPLPVPTPEEQEDFVLALRDARDQKLEFIQRRNDCSIALHHSEFFENLPPATQLQQDAATYTRLINAVIDHAVRLSRGAISPPRIFDAGALQPPIVIPLPLNLQRKTLPGTGSGQARAFLGIAGFAHFALFDIALGQTIKATEMDVSGVAVTADRRQLFLVDRDQVRIFDVAAQDVLAQIPFGGTAIAASADGKRVYAAGRDVGPGDQPSHVSVIDTQSKTVTATIRGLKDSAGIVVTRDGTRAYVIGGSGGSLRSSFSVIDLERAVVANTVSLGFSTPTSITLTPDEKRAYICFGGEDGGDTIVIDTATGRDVGHLVGKSGNGVAFTPDGAKAYQLDAQIQFDDPAGVTVFDTSTLRSESTIALDGDFLNGIVMHPNGVHAYAIGSRSVLEIDIVTRRQANRFPVGDGRTAVFATG